MALRDPRDVVRSGYDAVSYQYRGDDDCDGQYDLWITELRENLPTNAAVLDLGAGLVCRSLNR